MKSEVRSQKSDQSPKIALFDVDRTLIDGYSGYFTTMHLIRNGAVRRRRVAQAVLYKLISKVYHGNVRRMYEIILSDIAGWSIEDILKIGRECFEEDIHPRLFRQGVDLIEKHKRQGHPSYFVTAGPYMTIKILGDYLGVCSDYASGPVIREGYLQKEIQEPLAYGDGKLKVARLIAQREEISLKDCYFYTDNIDDLLLLEEVGYPHAVNPDRKLEKICKERGWPILLFRECVGDDRGLRSHGR